MDNSIQAHQKELCNKLWAMANALRGNMEAYEFKNYILGMIFYYYLSDRTEKYMANLLKDDGIGYEEAWADEEYKTAVVEEALRDLGRLYERMVMRRHTNGGYQHVVDELWKQCEIWNVDLIIMYQNVACKNMATVQGILDDQAREQNRKMIWIEHDLMDPRTVSRRQMRDKVSEYMRTVMHAEPLDPTLVDFEDEICL